MSRGSKAKPTIEDVAREVGMSTATVSRALHLEKTTKVSEATRQRVREVARALIYKPNLAGRSLATGRANMVAFCTVDAYSYYYSRITFEISTQACERNYDLIVSNPQHNTHPSGTLRPITAHCDGIIACDVNRSSQYFADLVQLKNVPLVGIGMYYPQDRDHIGFNLYEPSLAALQHLLGQGCRRVVHVTGSTEGDDPRLRAYYDTMRDAGREAEIVVVDQLSRAQGLSRLRAFLEAERAAGRALPDALFCVNDEVALGCYRALYELGVRVPDDMLVMGCDGIEDSEFQACPISTMRLPLEQMCGMAWDFLENRINEPDMELQEALLQPELIIRQSTQRS